MENKTENCEKILKFYFLSNRLKITLRSGWKLWSVEGVRVESIAEHVYGTLMLAVAVFAHTKEYDDLDIEKVALMLALHETEEILIGDITPYEYDKYKTKNEIGREAVCKLFKDTSKKQFVEILDEFRDRETKEAQFAFMCDKLEADLQAYIYQYNFNMQKASKICLDDDNIKKMMAQGIDSPDKLFLESDISKYSGAFLDVANYLKNLEERI